MAGRQTGALASRFLGHRRGRVVAVGAVLALVLGVGVVPGASQAEEPAAVAASGMDWSNLDAGEFPDGPVNDFDPGSTDMIVYLNLVANTSLVPTALAVSDPTATTYAQHLSLADAVSAFGAPAATRGVVEATVAEVGGDVQFGPTNTWARVELTVAQASDLFDVDFVAYDTESEGAEPGYPCQSGPTLCVAPAVGSGPSLPEALEGIVDAAFGLVFATSPAPVTPTGPPVGGPPGDMSVASEPRTPASPYRSGTAEGCDAALNGPNMRVEGSDTLRVGLAPNQLATAYGYDQLADAGLTGAGVRLAMLELGGNVAPGDITTYAACFGYEAPSLRQVNVGGDAVPGGAWLEATLDALVVSQIVPGLEAFDLYSYNGPQVGGLAWVLEMLALPLIPEVYGAAPPDIVSVSYGECDPIFDVYASGLVTMTEQMLAVAATTPMTYLVSSGDNGSSGCQRDGIPSLVAAAYPSTSNWVLAVGGTSLALNDDNTIAAEAVWNDTLFGESLGAGGGGGGTSTIVERAPWQRGPGVAGGSKRLNPDVASFADELPGWIIYCTGVCAEAAGLPDSGGYLRVGGTSAATPQVASILALATEAGRAVGQPALGFVNPLIYELARNGASSLLDITVTNNDVNNIGCCDATVGHDLASGWGSVNAAVLVAELANPTVVLTATGPTAGSPEVVLDASGSTAPIGGILDYGWDTTGDGIIDVVTTDPVLTVPVELPNPWNFSVTARTVTGRTATATATVTAPAPAPVVPRFTG